MNSAFRKWRGHRLVPIVALVIAGCTSSSGVIQIGPDSYHVTTTAQALGGAPFARDMAIETANRYCAKQGQTTLITQFAFASQVFHGASDITFRCVATMPSASNQF